MADYLTPMIADIARGTTGYAAIRPHQFLSLEIPLPPLAEQRRIVARIDALAARIAEARGLRAQAVAEADILLEAEYNKTISYLERIGYPITTVRDQEELITSGPRNFSSHYSNSGLRFYRAQDLSSNGKIMENNVVYVEMPEGMSTRAIVQEGDVLIVITGATIGRTAVISAEHPQGLVSQHVGLIRLNKKSLDPFFFHYCILSSTWTGGQINEAKYGQGKPGLNLTNLRDLRFPLPPLPEQRRIVAYLDDVQARVDALKAMQAATAAELDALLPAVLDQAFRGAL